VNGAGAHAPGVPTPGHVNHLLQRARPEDRHVDIGAYEYRPPVVTGIRLLGADCFIDFSAVSGNQYDLECSTGLETGDWSPVATNIPGVDGEVQTTHGDAANHPSRFYRVRSSM
jgi:hypothetical protein